MKLNTIANLLAVLLSTAAYNAYANGPPPYAYPFDRPYDLRVKFLYVAFRETETELEEMRMDSVMTYDLHQAVVEQYRQYIAHQSNNSLTLSTDSGIILKPGSELSASGDTTVAWMANRSSTFYINPDQGYLDNWVDIRPWYGDELPAEILYKIWKKYEGLPNPFGGVNDPEYDLLCIVWLTNIPPYASPVGGYPYVNVNPTNANLMSGGFFRVKVAPEIHHFAGTSLTATTEIDDPTPTLDVESALFSIAHEIAHVLKPGDGPPSLQLTCPWCESVYYYGGLNLLCQRYIAGGIPPIADPHLAKLPWNSVIDFTGSSIQREKLYNVRNGGAIYRYMLLDDDPGPKEYFIMAYHADVEPPNSASGLAIWHCSEPVAGSGDSTVFDLESAIGLWNFADDPNQTVYEDPWTLEDIEEDRERGYDNHDLWKRSSTNGAVRDVDEYSNYIGSYYDFFRYKPEINADPHDQDEFSFRTNPNCYGYANDESVADRRQPQAVPNGLVVRIRGEASDARGDYLEVDLLSGPANDVISPFGGEVFSSTADYEVEWAHEYDDYISAVDIWLSNDNGRTYPFLLAENLPYVTTLLPWHGEVGSGQGTEQGKIKVVYKSDPEYEFPYSGYYVSGGTFTVESTITVSETILMPQDGDHWFEGHGHEMRWDDYWYPVNPVVDVDLFYRRVRGGDWSLYPGELEVTHSEEGYYRATVVPTREMCGTTVELRLDFTADGNVGHSYLDGTILVYPVDSVFDGTISEAAGVNYVGQPYSTITYKGDENEKPDLVVTLASGEDGQTSVLYDNQTPFHGDPEFLDRTDDLEQADKPELGSLGATAAPLGNSGADGRDAVFIAHQEGPKVRLLVPGISGYENVVDDDLWIRPEDRTLLSLSTCGAWWDVDRNGAVDLVVGRADVAIGVGKPDILFRQFVREDGTRFFLAHPDETAFGETKNRSMVWSTMYPGSMDVFVEQGNTIQWYQVRRVTADNIDANLVRTFDLAEGPSGQWSPVGVQAADLDRDGDLDIACASNDGRTAVVWNEPSPQQWHIEVIDTSPMDDPSLAVADVDLDGWSDVVLGGTKDGEGSRLLRNLKGLPAGYSTTGDFVDFSLGMGLDEEYGPASGVLLADLDLDGDSDLVLGRSGAAQEGRVYATRAVDGGEAPDNWSLTVELGAESGWNPGSIGAVVKVTTTADEPLGLQIIDGGSGRGSQQPRPLVFGLGQYSGSVKVKAYWPQGRTDEEIVAHQAVKVDLEPSTPSTLALIASSVAFETVASPDQFDWVFTWRTNYGSDPAADTVHITAMSGCDFQEFTLEVGPSVDAWITPVVVAGGVEFEHTLTWYNAPCDLNCRFTYEVSSGDGGRGESITSSSYTGKLPRVCPLNE